MRKVVVTGVGMVTPLGVGSDATWTALMEGQVGTTSLSAETVSGYIPPFVKSEDRKKQLVEGLSCRVAAPVKDTASKLFHANSRETRAQKMALAAVNEAITQSGLLQHLASGKSSASDVGADSESAAGAIELDRVGVNFGMGMPGLPEVAEAAVHLYGESSFSPNRIVPYFVPKVLGNTISGAIALKHGFLGPNHASVTACATGAHCIGDAFRWLQHGDAEVVICGASEACITPVSIAGFNRMKALATKFNDQPETASRPFDQTRGGFVMGEGAGALVLQTEESAKRTGAPILAEVKGYGMSGDAYHVSSPHPEGRGVSLCLRAALRDAQVDAKDIGYVNAHATSTPMGDEIELKALERELRQDSNGADPLAVSSTKGALGHLLGAAGAVEAIISILALSKGTAPATANLTAPVSHDATRVNLIAEPTALGTSPYVLSTSFGFGGTNAALIFGKCCSL